jgi:hypothetical protein
LIIINGNQSIIMLKWYRLQIHDIAYSTGTIHLSLFQTLICNFSPIIIIM